MINEKDKLPYMPFYVGDWFKCPEVRSLSPDYRGLWFDLLCYMWESHERGVMIQPNGKPYSDDEIIRMVGLDNQNSGIWLTALLEKQVCSRRPDGAIFSRRMVKDEKIRILRRNSGRKGGNPNLLVNHKLTNLVNQNPEYEYEYEYEYNNSNKNKNKGVVKGEKEKSKIIPPEPEWVEEYFAELKLSKDEAGKFIDYFTANGWRVGGKAQMRDWKAAARNWKRNSLKYQKGVENGTETDAERERREQLEQLSTEAK